MNPEPDTFVFRKSTLMDHINLAGWAGQPILFITVGLLIAGVFLVLARPPFRVRWAYLLCSPIPALLGLCGTLNGAMHAFEALGPEGLLNSGHALPALGEILHALAIGLFGSALLATTAMAVMSRREKTAHETPSATAVTG